MPQTNAIVLEDQGGREYMEDRTEVFEPLINDYEYYAVFDGHGGSNIVDFVQKNVREALIFLIDNKLSLNLNEDEILYQALRTVSDRLPLPAAKTQGTTVVLVLKRGLHMWIANCGDSRAIVTLNNGSYIQLTEDHKPNRPDEYLRISRTGGFVAPSFKGDVYRVNGSLAVSRSIGDLDLFPHVTWKPEMTYAQIASSFKYLFIATDGIWDVIQNREVSVLLQYYLLSGRNNNILNDICTLARARGSTDNISMILVRLQQP